MHHPFIKSGYIPPVLTDNRNFIYEKAVGTSPFPIAYKTDISAIPIFDQDKIPDCVENAVTFVKKYHDYKATGTVPDYARRFLAALTVKKDGFPIDNGTNIQNALSIAHDETNGGICESSFFSDDHTLDTRTFSDYVLIPQAAYRNATTHTIKSYAFLQDLSVNGLKNAIYQNGLVVVGALINQNWWTDVRGNVTWDKGAILPIRPPKTKDPKVDTTLSGHCFVLFGYDDQYIYFVNSFSSEWGDKGIGYFAVDEVPFIYEAAPIVDLTAEQIAALKQSSDALQQAEQVLQQNPSTAEVTLVGRLIAVITVILKSVFGGDK